MNETKNITEIQGFSLWIKVPLLILILFMIYISIRLFGTSGFWGIVLGGLLPSFLVFCLLIFSRLTTIIHDTGISFRFFPFQTKQKKIDWKNIKECSIRKYKPIKEYGGWGIRNGMKGKAYNTKGNIGIQIKLKDERSILIGTQQPDKVKGIMDLHYQRF